MNERRQDSGEAQRSTERVERWLRSARRGPALVIAAGEARLIAANPAGAHLLGLGAPPERPVPLDSAMPAIMDLRRTVNRGAHGRGPLTPWCSGRVTASHGCIATSKSSTTTAARRSLWSRWRPTRLQRRESMLRIRNVMLRRATTTSHPMRRHRAGVSRLRTGTHQAAMEHQPSLNSVPIHAKLKNRSAARRERTMKRIATCRMPAHRSALYRLRHRLRPRHRRAAMRIR